MNVENGRTDERTDENRLDGTCFPVHEFTSSGLVSETNRDSGILDALFLYIYIYKYTYTPNSPMLYLLTT